MLQSWPDGRFRGFLCVFASLRYGLEFALRSADVCTVPGDAPSLLPALCFPADSVEEKVIPMLEWLQMELRASPNEVSCLFFFHATQPSCARVYSGGVRQPRCFSFRVSIILTYMFSSNTEKYVIKGLLFCTPSPPACTPAGKNLKHNHQRELTAEIVDHCSGLIESFLRSAAIAFAMLVGCAALFQPL